MKIITSRQNEEIKNLTQLHQTKYRKNFKRFLAQGIRTVTTLMSRFEPLQLYMTEEFFNQHKKDFKTDNITLISQEVLEKISTTTSSQGIIGLFAIPKPSDSPLTKGLVLCNITDPGNMGTLIRTAAAMNATTVVLIDGVDPWSPKVVQATAGTLASVNIIECSWQDLLIRKKQLKLCALVVKDGQEAEILSRDDILIVIGNEAAGIPTQWLLDCELSCTLAMPGKTESLNAAIAGSIALYLAFIKK